jgi:sigma-B regulation protein RsbU (phosphoserine phosphatase)
VISAPLSSTNLLPAECKRIVIAEDDDDARHLLGTHLSHWGYTVHPAADGQQATEILDADDPPAIALLDWAMPGVEGIDVCRLLRQQPDRPYTYLIFLTGRGDKQQVAAGLEAGADDYVTKPCDLVELRARLQVGERIVTLERNRARQVHMLQQTLDQVHSLKELIPICAWCKRVQDDADYWHSIEEYLYRRTGSDFTHGICPSCLEDLRADLPKQQPNHR